MSAFGTKRTSKLPRIMSAFGGKADISYNLSGKVHLLVHGLVQILRTLGTHKAEVSDDGQYRFVGQARVDRWK